MLTAVQTIVRSLIPIQTARHRQFLFRLKAEATRTAM